MSVKPRQRGSQPEKRSRQEITTMPEQVDPKWGKPYSGTEFVLNDGRTVRMYRNRNAVRYYDTNGEQVGPEHRNVVPALVWAWAQPDWHDPSTPPWLLTGIRREIASSKR
jgi:hypothetical protein